MPLSRRLLLLAPPAIGLAYLARADNGIERLDAPPLEGVSGVFSQVKGVRHADLKGSVTLLHAIASWCPFCQQESAFMRTLAHDRRFQLVGLFVKDAEANAKAYISRYGNPYAALGFDADGRAAQQVGVRGVPNSFILDKQGRIVHTRRGMLTKEYFGQTMLPLIESLGRAAPAAV
jgi:cytochrome c biogenesis protein CcmG, thiol:disulfide interchange protein DsbE